jgi:hypothetical protein
LFSFLWELNIVLQGQALRDEMVVDQVKDTSRKQVGRNIKVAGIASTELQSVYGEAMVRDVCVCGREYRGFGGSKWRRLGVVVRVIQASLS